MNDRIEVSQGEGGLWGTTFPLVVPKALNDHVAIRHGFLGSLKVIVDGERAPQGPRRAQYLVPTRGGVLELTLRPGSWGTSPVVTTKTQTADIGRRIQGTEWLWVGLPLVLPILAVLGSGGMVDIVVGFLAFAANIRVFLNDGFSLSVRYLCSLVSMGLFLVAYLAATAVTVLLR